MIRTNLPIDKKRTVKANPGKTPKPNLNPVKGTKLPAITPDKDKPEDKCMS